MNPRKGRVLDANILMRAVLGRRVRELLEVYEDVATFYSPDVCFEEARHYVSQVLEKRGLNPEIWALRHAEALGANAILNTRYDDALDVETLFHDAAVVIEPVAPRRTAQQVAGD